MQTFTHGDIEIAVKEMTIGDDVRAQIVGQKLTLSTVKDEWGIWQTFADLVGATASAKGLPFDPATLHSQEPAVIQQAYAWFLEQPKRLKTKWQKAYNAENPKDDDPKNG